MSNTQVNKGVFISRKVRSGEGSITLVRVRFATLPLHPGPQFSPTLISRHTFFSSRDARRDSFAQHVGGQALSRNRCSVRRGVASCYLYRAYSRPRVLEQPTCMKLRAKDQAATCAISPRPNSTWSPGRKRSLLDRGLSSQDTGHLSRWSVVAARAQTLPFPSRKAGQEK